MSREDSEDDFLSKHLVFCTTKYLSAIKTKRIKSSKLHPSEMTETIHDHIMDQTLKASRPTRR